MTDTVLTRVAALKTMPNQQLKQQWRDLFETEPPPYNRRFLEHRLAYRIQELAYGGLKPTTVARLRELAEDLDGGNPANRRRHHQDRPMPGTRLMSRQSTPLSADLGESSLDCPADQSGHANVLKGGLD